LLISGRFNVQIRAVFATALRGVSSLNPGFDLARTNFISTLLNIGQLVDGVIHFLIFAAVG
jgi:hypothetical protein